MGTIHNIDDGPRTLPAVHDWDAEMASHFPPPRYRETAISAAERARRTYCAGTQPRRGPYIPLGCDQNGRIKPTRVADEPVDSEYTEQEKRLLADVYSGDTQGFDTGPMPLGRIVPATEARRHRRLGLALTAFILTAAAAFKWWPW